MAGEYTIAFDTAAGDPFAGQMAWTGGNIAQGMGSVLTIESLEAAFAMLQQPSSLDPQQLGNLYGGIAGMLGSQGA